MWLPRNGHLARAARTPSLPLRPSAIATAPMLHVIRQNCDRHQSVSRELRGYPIPVHRVLKSNDIITTAETHRSPRQLYALAAAKLPDFIR